ncbi:MAG: thioredoxin family protein [Akkermansiaceae bacterium]
MSTALPLAAEWLDDLKAGQEKAAKEKKHLFLVFTSVKSSGACQQLERKVLSRDSFQQTAAEKFVLVRLDVPPAKQPEGDGELKGNRFLARVWGVETYPTALYLDGKGRPYLTESGSLNHGAEDYAAHLVEQAGLQTSREEALERAYQEQGLERAKLIIDVIKSAPSSASPSLYGEQLKELAKLDPEDSLNFQKPYKLDLAFKELESALASTFHKDAYDEVVKLVDDFQEQHKPDGEIFQKAQFRKLAALRHGGKTEEAVRTAEGIIAAGPETSHGRLAAQILKSLK